MGMRIYLDYAAAAPVSPGALKAYTKAVKAFGNPSAAHEEGRAGKAILEDARKRIAHLAGAKPDAIVFTAGATEANALAIQGHVKALQERGVPLEKIHLLYLPGAHASTDAAMTMLAKEGARVELLPIKDGDIDLTTLAGLLRPETALVSMEAVSSETGARFNTRGVRQVLDAHSGAPVLLHVDATQLPFAESFERTRLAADLISLDAQKVGGVRGIGCLIVSPRTTLLPAIGGGGQERGLRSGTETPAAALAFAIALEEAAGAREAFTARALAARNACIATITSALPDAVVNEGKENVAHILNFSFPGRDTDFLAALLDERGIAVSTRSACETDSVEGSRAVQALTGDSARATATLRISWGPVTKTDDLRRAMTALIEAVRFIDHTRL
ncbi:MAG TPA: aminotransferase class V-fold PLP-dependent enzyme [Candidatus Paceibacterota bacterium]|nr:aminotransferase class V-fold PLP-dependent enzyme [Candidatus Paceibacterota bacterium]